MLFYKKPQPGNIIDTRVLRQYFTIIINRLCYRYTAPQPWTDDYRKSVMNYDILYYDKISVVASSDSG